MSTALTGRATGPGTDDEPPRRARTTRAARQEQTRRALVHAARAAFARDGFHGARLDRIATEAGFSKGAVYSNFESKADLFLAVMDENLAAVGDEPWDTFERVDAPPEPGSLGAADAEHLAEAMSGFALATLEFIATAARDATMRTALAQRTQRVVDLYAGVAAHNRTADDPLPAERLGVLLAALDQGVALLTLSGAVDGDASLLRTGLGRLVAAGAVADGADDVPAGPHGHADTGEGAAAAQDAGADRGSTGLHDDELRRRIATSILDGL